jgi:hypothetical protein
MAAKTVSAGQTTVTFVVTPATPGNRTIALASTSPDPPAPAGGPFTYDGLGSAVAVPAGQTTATFTVTPGTTGNRTIALASTSPDPPAPAGGPFTYDGLASGAAAYPAAMMMGL